MVQLQIEGLSASYGRTRILEGIDLFVASGSTTAILGASGCGKTTLLRAVAGFVRPTSGTVRLGDQLVSGPRLWVPPERRRIGYVSQDGNLFPHLSVAENVTFGLPWRQRRVRARVGELLELVGLSADLADRTPDRLSGGQQQRVSLARALAREPELVLLDEPFSSLDVALRSSTRDAVAEALRATGSTVVLVTHDQSEALSFADQVAVMRDGRFAHVAGPVELYQHPADLETATFVGEAVVLPGEVDGDRVVCSLGALPYVGAHADGPVVVLVRPEQILVTVCAGAPTTESRGQPAGSVVDVAFLGADAVVAVRLADGASVRARVPAQRVLYRGTEVRLAVDGPVLLYPRPDGPGSAVRT